MRFSKMRLLGAVATAALLFAGSAMPVLAGPPLICHSIEIGDAPSLPWGKHWREAKADYNLNNLISDTEAFLGPDVPVLVRMETIRRASLYAMLDPGIAAQLLSRLKSRAMTAESGRSADVLAMFDLGYLVETYRQAGRETRRIVEASGMDGYGFVTRALGLRAGDAEMQFAAALITWYPRRPSHEQHLRRALDGASGNLLLARNLMTHFKDRGKTVAELRASLATRKD